MGVTPIKIVSILGKIFSIFLTVSMNLHLLPILLFGQQNIMFVSRDILKMRHADFPPSIVLTNRGDLVCDTS